MGQSVFNNKLVLIILCIAALLRFWKLDSVPISPFTDELDVGYQAYSLFNTSRDYYGNFLPLHIQSFHEWRTPLSIYSTIPSIAIFGLTSLGIRFVPALYGTVSVVIMYLFVRKFVEMGKLSLSSEKFATLSALLLALSPWHIQYSRMGFEIAPLIFFFLLGLYLFLKAIDDSPKVLPLSMVSFCLMMWTYNTAKLFVPIFLLILAILFWKKLISLPRKFVIIASCVVFALTIPLMVISMSGMGTERFAKISIFESEVELENKLGDKFRIISPSQISINDKLFHNKLTYYGDKIISNYAEALSIDFLFVDGDPNLHHSIEGMGMFYIVEVVPMFIGSVLLLNSRVNNKAKLVIFFIVTIGILPSALTQDGGKHASRLVLMLPGLILLITYGLFRFSHPVTLFYVGGFLICFLFYQHNYWLINPFYSEDWWDSGWKEAVVSLKEMEENYEAIYVDLENEYKSVNFAFYYQLPPEELQSAITNGEKIGFPSIGEFMNVRKYMLGAWDTPPATWASNISNRELLMVQAEKVDKDVLTLDIVEEIRTPSGRTAFYLLTHN